MPSANGRAADAPGVGPAVDTLLEEEPIQDELAAPVEQLEQGPPPVRPLERVVALNPHHRHALPCGGELVHRGGDGPFALEQGRQGRVPLGLTDDGRTSDFHFESPSLMGRVARCLLHEAQMVNAR